MKRLSIFCDLMLAVTLITLSFSVEAQNFTVTDLGLLPGGTYSFSTSINNQGKVVGEADTSTGEFHAFLWDSVGGMQDLGTLAGRTFSSANDINNLGQVVGSSFTNQNDVHPFLWDNGLMIDLGTLAGNTGFAQSINDTEQVVGGAQTIDGVFHAFLWNAGTMQSLPTLPGGIVITLPGGMSRGAAFGINSVGQIVGWSTTVDGKRHAVLWEPPTYTPIDLGILPGTISSLAIGINDTGKVVGFALIDESSTFQSFRAFIWDSLVGMQPLGLLPGGSGSAASDINNSDQVVGEADTTGGFFRGFILSVGVMQDLGIPLGGTYSLAESINESGQIAGEGDTVIGETHAVIWTPVSLSPQQQIGILTTNVETLVTTGILNQGQGNALTSKLEAAISMLNKSNENTAINQLQAFINQIEALIMGGILPVNEGQSLIEAANNIINLITG